MEPNSNTDVDKIMAELIDCCRLGVMQQSDWRNVMMIAFGQALCSSVELAALIQTLSDAGTINGGIFRANCVKIAKARVEKMRTPQLLVPEAIGRSRTN